MVLIHFFSPDVLPHNISGFVIWLKAHIGPHLYFWLVKELSQSAAFRVRSTGYPQNSHHLSRKVIPSVLEVLHKSEHHKPFGLSALNSQEHLSLSKRDKFAAGFSVVWHGYNSLLSSRQLVIIYIVKYVKGHKNDREGTEISEPLRNAALSFLMLGCPALPGPASWPITPNSWMQEVVKVPVEGKKGILRWCKVPKPSFILCRLPRWFGRRDGVI